MALKLNVGDVVDWVSSNCKKTGRVVAVIPAGSLPREIDATYNKLESCTPRSEESYVVLGTAKGKVKGVLYWPRSSLLRPVTALTDIELEWCRSHPDAVRRAMLKA